MPYNIRIVSTYPPRKCGIGTFSRNLAEAFEHFTGEVGNIRIAAIDKDNLCYTIPVDLVIDQYNPESWNNATAAILARANESNNPTVVLLQHEYGLDPGKDGQDCQGTNFVDMAKTFQENGLTCITYLHTLISNPNPHQKETLRLLAKYCNGLVVTTENAIKVLESYAYGIAHSKIKHIDHGIRMQRPSQYDRLAIKKEYGLQNRFLVTTLGLNSPNKGIQYGLRAYARFLDESCTEKQRKQIVYLIAGQYHPEFVKAEGGQLYIQYRELIEKILEENRLKHCTIKELGATDFEKYDIVFLDTFIDDSTLLKLYGATNIMLLPYLEMQQISSGILADTLGSGRVAIATKFMYAVELIHSNTPSHSGVVIDRHARGVLVDPGEPSVEQIAQALDYLVFNKDKRLRMEKQAHQRGYQMRWNNSAWGLLQYIDFERDDAEIITGRGIEFHREKPSIYQKKHTLIANKPINIITNTVQSSS